MKITKTIGALLLSAQVLVAAQTLTYNFSDPITNSITPYGTGPWLTIQLIELEDYTRIIMSSNLTDGEFISKIGMNLNTSVDYDSVIFTPSDYQGIFTTPEFEIGDNIFNAGGGNNFDMRVSFATKQSNRFNLNDSFIFDVNVPISTFSNTMITHIQGIGSDSQSTWLVPNTIPEPNTFLFGLIGTLFLLRKRR